MRRQRIYWFYLVRLPIVVTNEECQHLPRKLLAVQDLHVLLSLDRDHLRVHSLDVLARLQRFDVDDAVAVNVGRDQRRRRRVALVKVIHGVRQLPRSVALVAVEANMPQIGKAAFDLGELVRGRVSR